jgi:hypothetical protein
MMRQMLADMRQAVMEFGVVAAGLAVVTLVIVHFAN